MAQFVVMGAMLTCSFGATPSPLTVVRPTVTIGGRPAATVMDYVPMANIMSFGMCKTQSNPAVAAATAAALGTPTPAPCIPNTVSQWIPGNLKVTIQNQAALMSTCSCMCAWGGKISITSAGQLTVNG